LGDFFKNNIFKASNIAKILENTDFYGKCQAGYVCKEGSTVSNPNDNIMGYKCPKGAFCP
jgi:hypothetical protein